jgi:GWxTD domain-containing protein
MPMTKACLRLLSFFPAAVLLTAYLSGAGVQQKPPAKDKKPDEITAQYKKWVDEEVLYIISDNEREVFKSLRTDEEREGFIRTFWRRRDPTPETPVNEFREEHYRRLEWASKRYFEGKAGWRTDRGRVYIMFGPPDFFETNPGGGRGFLFDPSGPTAEFPSEVWTYRYIPGLKERIGRIDFIFVNTYNSGSYELTTNPALANALRNVSLPARDVGYRETRDEAYPGEKDRDMMVNPLEQLALLAELSKSRGEVLEEMERSERLRRLRGVVDANESLAALPFVDQESFLKGPENIVSIPLSIEVAGKDVQFQESGDRYRGLLNFYIEVKDLNQTVCQISDRLEMNLKEETYRRRMADAYQYKHRLELKPGEYFFHLVVWDELSSNVGYKDKRITVPAFPADGLCLSDVILAKSVQVVEVPKESVVVESKDIPALQALEKSNLKVPDKLEITRRQGDPFTFGNLMIGPNPSAVYKPDEELVFFYQVYHPVYDPALNTAGLLIEHQIWKGDRMIATIDGPQEARIPAEQKSSFVNSGARYTLSGFEPGQYTLRVMVKDLVSGQAIEKRLDFIVK